MVRPAPHVVVATAIGYLDEVHRDPFLEVSQEIHDSGDQVACFFDWRELTGYATSVRVQWTRWMLKNHASVTSTHILCWSKLVQMGVSTASMALALAGIQLSAYSDEEAFDAALRHELSSRS